VREQQDEVADRCQVCDLRKAIPSESLVHADDVWTANLVLDVPGWIMVSTNRHSGDWLWGLSDDEAATLGPLVRQLSAAAKAEADVERVYLMGFGEQWQHFHFMLLSRRVSTPAEFRGPGILAHAAELADRDEAFRAGARIRERLSRPS
jgi:diadenosine tetraphosphate (Ap4A) HIT family hydrolase